jgi:glycosyltransferase involved in cell wall biosynthesis
MSEPEELKVLLLAGRLEVRGSCAYTLRLAQRLGECSISATLASPDLHLLDRKTRALLNAHEYRRLDTPLIGRVIRRRLLHDLAAQPPELIHVQSRQALSLGAWLARKLRRPFVVTVHDHLGPRETIHVDRRWCRRIIAVSNSVRDDLIERQKFPSQLVSVVSGGVDVGAAGDRLPVLDPGHVPVVGMAAPLEAVKGATYFLGAARRALDVRPELEFLVAGGGPEEGNLRRLARELGISEKITFVPVLRSLTEPLSAMDVFCLPSLQQGLGTIMLEAMALGRPVIASGVGGVSSVVQDGRTGLIVPPGDSEALARRILELLDNPTRARAIGEEARRYVADEFDASHMVLQTAELYREICACQPRSSPLVPN